MCHNKCDETTKICDE